MARPRMTTLVVLAWGAILGACEELRGQAEVAMRKPAVSPVSETVTIQAIDTDDQVVVVKTVRGDEVSIYARPDVQLLPELVVGQRVFVTYYESIVFAIDQAGRGRAALNEVAAAPSGADRRLRPMRGRQTTATVEVTGIDRRTPSLTVKAMSGRVATRKVDDSERVRDVKVGDRIAITYTEAELMHVR